jgi:hypothetical protein
MMGEWPKSKGKGAVIEADLKDAHLLQVSYTVLYDKNPEVTSMDAFNNHVPDLTYIWANVPGLRTKSFTTVEGTDMGSGIYVFKTKADLDAYLQSDLFNQMGTFPHLADLKTKTF